MYFPIAPDFEKRPSARISIDAEFGWISEHDKKAGRKNGMIDPYIFADVLTRYHKGRSIEWSLGGYFEPRGRVWEDTYIADEGKVNHLGVDINLPQRTKICVSRPCTVVHIYNDHPEAFGWGTRIIVRIADTHLIYAHLDQVGDLYLGQELFAGTVIGTVAPPECNGGWYPHVHLQAFIAEAFGYFFSDDHMCELDGYGYPCNVLRDRRWFPDPLQWVDL